MAIRHDGSGNSLRSRNASQMTRTPPPVEAGVAENSSNPQSEVSPVDALCPLCLRAPMDRPVLLHAVGPDSDKGACIACERCALRWKSVVESVYSHHAAETGNGADPPRDMACAHPCPQCGVRVRLSVDEGTVAFPPWVNESSQNRLRDTSAESSARSDKHLNSGQGGSPSKIRNCTLHGPTAFSTSISAHVPRSSRSANASEPERHPLCGVCEQNESDCFCVQCDFPLCSVCRTSCHSRGRFATHAVIANTNSDGKKSDARRGDESSRAAIPQRHWPAELCEEHIGQKLDLFCLTCAETVCVRCCFGSRSTHGSHDVAPLAEVVAKVQENILTQSAALDTMEGIVSRAATVLGEKSRHAVRDSASGCAAGVVRLFSKLRAALQTREDALLAEIEERAREADDTLRCASKRCADVAREVSDVTRVSKTLCADVSGGDYMRLLPQLQRRIDAVRQCCLDCVGSQTLSSQSAALIQGNKKTGINTNASVDDCALAACEEEVVAQFAPKDGFHFRTVVPASKLRSGSSDDPLLALLHTLHDLGKIDVPSFPPPLRADQPLQLTNSGNVASQDKQGSNSRHVFQPDRTTTATTASAPFTSTISSHFPLSPKRTPPAPSSLHFLPISPFQQPRMTQTPSQSFISTPTGRASDTVIIKMESMDEDTVPFVAAMCTSPARSFLSKPGAPFLSTNSAPVSLQEHPDPGKILHSLESWSAPSPMKLAVPHSRVATGTAANVKRLRVPLPHSLSLSPPQESNNETRTHSEQQALKRPRLQLERADVSAENVSSEQKGERKSTLLRPSIIGTRPSTLIHAPASSSSSSSFSSSSVPTTTENANTSLLSVLRSRSSNMLRMQDTNNRAGSKALVGTNISSSSISTSGVNTGISVQERRNGLQSTRHKSASLCNPFAEQTTPHSSSLYQMLPSSSMPSTSLRIGDSSLSDAKATERRISLLREINSHDAKAQEGRLRLHL